MTMNKRNKSWKNRYRGILWCNVHREATFGPDGGRGPPNLPQLPPRCPGLQVKLLRAWGPRFLIGNKTVPGKLGFQASPFLFGGRTWCSKHTTGLERVLKGGVPT